MKIVKIFRTYEKHKVYGKIVRIDFPNKSRIYISKKGWNLIMPNTKKYLDLINKKGKIELNIPYSEINLALKESIKAGYTDEAN